MTAHSDQNGSTDLDDLTDKVSKLTDWVDSLRQWQSRMGGGIAVAIGFLSVLQVASFGLVAYAVTEIKGNFAATASHSIELAKMQERVVALEMTGPRFTSEMNSNSDARLKEELKDFVLDSIPPEWVKKELTRLADRLTALENDIRRTKAQP